MANEQNDQKEQNHSAKVSARIYSQEARIGKEITLNKEQIRHLKVLRLQKGEKIHLFDGKGHEYEAEYSEKVRTGNIVANRELAPQKEPTVKITLAIAAPKGSRIDVLVEKVSELGISNIVPIICSRSIVKPRESKTERLRKTAIEACAQSGRSMVPTISEPVPFGELLSKVKEYNHAFLCHARGTPLTKTYCECKSALVIVGPEGDFTTAEIEAAKEAGCTVVSLGPTILRTETAGIAAVAQIIGMSQKTEK